MKRLRVLETELFHLFADMMQCRNNGRVHPYLAQPLTSPLTWTWGHSSELLPPGWGDHLRGMVWEPSKFFGYVGESTVITYTSTYECLPCSSVPSSLEAILLGLGF